VDVEAEEEAEEEVDVNVKEQLSQLTAPAESDACSRRRRDPGVGRVH
jgi:hypothetical protein